MILFIVNGFFPIWFIDVSSNLFCLQLLAFLQGLFTFYHEGYELAHEFEPYKQQLQFNLQNVSLNSSAWLSNSSSPPDKIQILQMVHREISWLCGGSDLLWLAGPLDCEMLLNLTESWSGALNQTSLLCPSFLSLWPQRFQPQGPNFVFDLKCQHCYCDNFSLLRCPQMQKPGDSEVISAALLQGQ